MRPRGMWPSEGSVSNEALKIAHELGLKWMATDEGVLCRSLGTIFDRNGEGKLDVGSASQLYQICRWEQGQAEMNMVFRDHSLSDLIGFVYSGVPAQEAADDFIRRVKQAAEPVLEKGKTADFLVLDANPLDDITNTRRINAVYLRGAAIDRAALRARWTGKASL